MNPNNNDINKTIQSDLNLDSDDTDSDDKYDNLYSDPEEAFQVVNLLSQAYNEGNKNINAKNVQNFIVSNLNTINENVLLENSNNTNEIHNIPSNNTINYNNHHNNTYQNFNRISTDTDNTITKNNENGIF